MSRSDILASIESGMLSVQGLNNSVIRANKVLEVHEAGFLLADASAGQTMITLPKANRIMDVRVQRVDNSANALLVYAASGEKIKFHTHLRPEGYPFCMVLGGGDFWHLRSDGAGSWLLLDRFDNTPLGRIAFETTTAPNPGGWGRPDARLLGRGDWPWLWDHAQQSGMLVDEAQRAGMEGAWTRGDGTSTFRIPDFRGEFLRMLDEGRGVDPGRTAASWRMGTKITGDNASAPAVQGIGNLAEVGVDKGDGFTSAIYYVGATQTETNAIYWGTVRPRSTAYPGRLKLI